MKLSELEIGMLLKCTENPNIVCKVIDIYDSLNDTLGADLEFYLGGYTVSKYISSVHLTPSISVEVTINDETFQFSTFSNINCEVIDEIEFRLLTS